MYDGFCVEKLDDSHRLHCGLLPERLIPNQGDFEELWALHPEEYHEIVMHGRPVRTPRWQQAFGKDYHYTNRTNRALPVPQHLAPVVEWAQRTIDDRLNGILLNWYDAKLGHYIGKHRDSITDMVHGAPIVTISLGESRTFRLRPWKGRGFVDFVAYNGTAFIMPYDTNLAWTHEVPRSARCSGRRISITMRAFR